MWEAEHSFTSEVSEISGVDVKEAVFLFLFFFFRPPQTAACAQASIDHTSLSETQRRTPPQHGLSSLKPTPAMPQSKTPGNQAPICHSKFTTGPKKATAKTGLENSQEPPATPRPQANTPLLQGNFSLAAKDSTHTSTQHKNPKQTRKTTQPWLPVGLNIC